MATTRTRPVVIRMQPEAEEGLRRLQGEIQVRTGRRVTVGEALLFAVNSAQTRLGIGETLTDTKPRTITDLI